MREIRIMAVTSERLLAVDASAMAPLARRAAYDRLQRDDLCRGARLVQERDGVLLVALGCEADRVETYVDAAEASLSVLLTQIMRRSVRLRSLDSGENFGTAIEVG